MTCSHLVQTICDALISIIYFVIVYKRRIIIMDVDSNAEIAKTNLKKKQVLYYCNYWMAVVSE